MPSGLIEDQHGMRSRRDMKGDFFEMHIHCLAVAMRQNQPCAFAIGGTYGTEYPRRSAALILGGARSSSALGPAAGELGLLANAGP